MQKKIGIITLNGYFNYGNRLQNFALQRVLEKQGFLVETVLFEIKIKKSKKQNMKLFLWKIKNSIKKSYNNQLLGLRTKNFKDFSVKYIKETPFIITKDKIPTTLGDSYDYFVAGSDQIWNPHYHKDTEITPSIEYMSFAPKNKRLSYAASFGVEKIEKDYIPRVKNGLENMNSILVREKHGVNVVQELTEKEAFQVLDPTLLLSKEEWLEISNSHINKPRKKFLLTYFLGEIPVDALEFINKFGEDNELEIIHLDKFDFPDYYNVSPAEFIDYINDASILFTDSFHGIVFSTILETPFVVFKRESSGPSMYSRIESLLGLLEIKGRERADVKEVDIFDMDFKGIKDKLENEKVKSLDLLIKSID